MQKTIGRTLTMAGAALALVCSAPGAQAQQLPPAQQIVDRYIAAVGGRGAMQRQNFRHVVAEMTIPSMGAMAMDMKFARPNRYTMKMDMPGMGTIAGGYNGQVGWAVNPMTGPQVLSGKELDQVRHSADMDATVDIARMYPTMQTVERSTAQGRPCYRVRMVTAEADTAYACFDEASGLMSTMESKQVSPMGTVEARVSFEDYKDFGGIKMPSRTVTSTMGQEMVMTIKSVTNEPIAESEFVLPAEVQALAGQNKPAAAPRP